MKNDPKKINLSYYKERALNSLKVVLFQMRRHSVRVVFIVLVIVIISMLAFQHYVLGFGWALWTGFGEYQVTKIDPTTLQTTEIQVQSRTFWDWLQLFIIPAALAFIAIRFSEQSAKSDQEIATDRNREELLQSYIDRMTELLLEKGLRNSSLEDEVRDIARTRTLTSLQRLDATRKVSLIRFLYEAGLIKADTYVINLKTANICEVDLRKEFLLKVNLSEAILIQANLELAFLGEANLSKANLFRSNLRQANLRRANLSGGDLTEANLCEAILFMTNLQEANLSHANLRGANLYDANLYRANLTSANLKGANLSLSNLRAATVSPDQLSQAASLERAIMPDGSKHK